MTDDIPTWLAKTRPHTAADDGWAASEEGDLTLAAIHRTAESEPAIRRMRILINHPSLVAAGGVVASAAVVIGLIVATPSGPTPPPTPVPHATGPRPQDMALVSYNTCSQLLAGLRGHAARAVGPNGLPGRTSGDYLTPYLSASAGPALGVKTAAPEHSTTNVHEVGVDEPDLVKNDGRRIVTVTEGVLRVIDAEQRKVTGTLDLTMYDGWQSAQLLVSGDRALVLLNAGPQAYFGPMSTGGASTASTYLLVDLSGSPRLMSTLHPSGGYVDARMVGSTVRLVVSSSPKITFGEGLDSRRLTEANRRAIRTAPLRAWLPTYEVSTGGRTTQHAVPCHNVRHPADYTGASMLTIYTIDLTKGLGDPQPVSVAADGDTVYATGSSLYVASNPNWYWGSNAARQRTQLHRFDISHPGAPTYLGSGSVPGRLLSQYSMSDYQGYLRVAATTYARRSVTSVYVLDANTLRISGHVGGLGRGEEVYAVRFLGPLGYVVTFRQLDPLYVIDLSNPAAPRTSGELTITGYSGYLHPVGDGRLVGVGQDATPQGMVGGLQVSLFDVSRAAHPRLLAKVVRPSDLSETQLDPHAFLYWPQTGLLVVPVQAWSGSDSGTALVVDVAHSALTTVGVISHPAGTGGIQRSLVIGDSLWTLSNSGLKANDVRTLAPQAWVPFS